MEESSTELTHELFDMWSKTYKTTCGGLPEVPAMDPMRERSVKSMQNLSASSNLFAAWMDSIIGLHGVFAEAARRMHEKMAADTEKGEISSEVYKDIYKIWLNTYSQTFKEFLKSDHFASDMGTLISCFVDLQRTRQELFEENYLKPEGLPTRTEIDGIYKEIYSLKKTVKGLTSQVRELSESEGTISRLMSGTAGTTAAIYSTQCSHQNND